MRLGAKVGTLQAEQVAALHTEGTAKGRLRLG